MLLANFNGKELRHRAVSLWQHGFLVEYFRQIWSKSIVIISSYTVSKFGRLLRHSVYDESRRCPGASTPYKRWSKCTMEKVRGGGGFYSLFQEFRGRRWVYCSITFLCKLIIFHTGIDQYKDVSFAEKINALPHPPKFLQNSPTIW